MKSELANLDATEQAELVRKKEVSPLELVDAAIARIEGVNPQLNAVITPLFDKARAKARAGAIPDGPLRGVPLMWLRQVWRPSNTLLAQRWGVGVVK